MKTLTGHLFLYDKDCPLCTTYTRWFVSRGILDAASRVAFQDIEQERFPKVDFALAQNKVALVHIESGEACYGMAAMHKVLGTRFPWINFFLNRKPLFMFMEQVYAFISMNRKIFIPVSCQKAQSCNPIRSWFWRIVFVVFFILFGTLLFSTVTLGDHLFDSRMFIIASTFFIYQGFLQFAAARYLKEPNFYDYIGHAAFTFFLTSILATVLAWLFRSFILGTDYFQQGIIVYSLIIPSFYFAVHAYRIRKADIHPLLTASAFISFILFIFILNLP